MSEERDLRDVYASSQEHIHAPEELIGQTMELLGDAEAVRDAEASMPPTSKPGLRMRFGRKPYYAAAACLALAALGVGAVHMAYQPTPENTGDAPSAAALANLDFGIKAYAAGTQTPLAAGDNGMIVFGRASDMALTSYEYATNGSYTGMLFRMDAENVKTVQAHISKGMLYRYDVRNATYASDPALLAEASTWKPQKRGIGDELGGYDMVSTGIADDGLAKNDPSKTYQVQTSKRLGQTAQLDYDQGDGEAYFGLWTDAYIPGLSDGRANGSQEELDAIANAFEGAELTVTVTFNDGRTSTQVIELHAGDFAAHYNDAEEDMETLEIQPELLAGAEDAPEGTFALRTVYGEVASSTNETFPYADEPINEYEGIVDAPMALPDADEGDFASEGMPTQVRDAASPFLAYASAAADLSSEEKLCSEQEEMPSIQIDGVSAETVSSLPARTELDKTEIVRMGSLDYWNRIAEQRSGFTLNSDWTPSEGASIVHIRYRVSNTASENKLFEAPYMQTPGSLDNDATFYPAANSADALMFAVTKSNGEACGWLDNDVVTLAPSETATVDAYYEVSNTILERGDLAIGFGANGTCASAVKINLAQ